METHIFYLIIGIIIAEYLLGNFLEYLNIGQINKNLPFELQGIYSAERYKLSQEYKKENTKFSFISSTFSTAIMLLVFLNGVFPWIDQWARSLSNNNIAISLLFFGLIMIIQKILELPFEIYSTFVIEAKYGFNKTSPKIFIADQIKSLLITAIIGGGLLSLIMWIYYATNNYFFLLAWGVMVGFMIFMSMFYANLIVPLFNKQTPLPDGELRTAIENFVQKVGFKLTNIYVIDGSKRSTKANAYFTGLGSQKRIVLYDTLINDLTTNEIVAVLAHEIGHYKKRHTLQFIGLSALQTGIIFYLLSLFLSEPTITRVLLPGADKPVFHIGLLVFGVVFSPITAVISLFTNALSRMMEYQADAFAKQNYSGEALGSALKKLSVNNLSNLMPHWLYVWVHYSHPPLADRLRQL